MGLPRAIQHVDIFRWEGTGVSEWQERKVRLSAGPLLMKICEPRFVVWAKLRSTRDTHPSSVIVKAVYLVSGKQGENKKNTPKETNHRRNILNWENDTIKDALNHRVYIAM